MDLAKMWHLAKTEPAAAAGQLIPQVLHQMSLTFSDRTRGYALSAPRRLLVALSTRCDLRCKMCCLWGEEGLWFKETPTFLKGDLDWETLQRLGQSVGPFRPSIILTGGEPLITRHWYDFAKLMKSYGCRTFMATGATLLARKAEQVAEVIDHVQVSFDGPDAATHDANRGTEGSFERVVAGILTVAQIKKERGWERPLINVCHTITDENYTKLTDMVRFVAELGVPINELAFQHLEFTDRPTLSRHEKFYRTYFGLDTNFWEGFLFQPETWDVDRLLMEIKQVRQMRKPKNVGRVLFRPDLTLEEARVFYTSGHRVPGRYDKKCLAPWQEAFIMANGDVWTCPDYIAGNIKKEDFMDLWNGGKYRKLRNVLNECGTMPACKACASLYVY